MTLSVDFIKFLSNLKIDIRKSELICGLLPVGLFSYVLLPEQILFYEYIAYGYFVFLVGYLISRIIFTNITIPRREKPEKIHIAELEDLAKKLRVKLPSDPFLVVDKRNLLAKVTLDNKIQFGNDFLNKLNSNEKIFVGGHEFFHIYGHEKLYMMVTVIPMFLLMAALSTFLEADLLVVIICIGPILVTVSLTKRSIEAMADLYGAEHAGKDAAISALTKGYEAKKHTLFDFHPHLQIRIRNIEKHYSEI